MTESLRKALVVLPNSESIQSRIPEEQRDHVIFLDPATVFDLPAKLKGVGVVISDGKDPKIGAAVLATEGVSFDVVSSTASGSYSPQSALRTIQQQLHHMGLAHTAFKS